MVIALIQQKNEILIECLSNHRRGILENFGYEILEEKEPF